MNETLPSPRDHAQAYALTFPGAYEEHPWGETVMTLRVGAQRHQGQQEGVSVRQRRHRA
jgi:hypothetical protein